MHSGAGSHLILKSESQRIHTVFFLATSAGVLITFFGPSLITYFGNGVDKVGYPWAMATLAS